MALLVASAAFGVGLAIAPVVPASADRGDITAFTDPAIHQPTDVVVGPDGFVWFTSLADDLIGRLDPATGDVTTYPGEPGEIDGPGSLTIGADGNVWFTNTGSLSIGRLDVGSGVVDAFPVGDGVTFLAGIALGPDGNVWFAAGRVGRVTPSGQITTFGLSGEIQASGPIVAGDDGRMWFGSPTHRVLGSIDVTTRATTYRSIAQLAGDSLVLGADGALWYTAWAFVGVQRQQVVRFDPTTSTTQTYELATRQGVGFRLTLGPEGSIWFVTRGDGSAATTPVVGRLNVVSGTVQTWSVPGAAAQPLVAIAAGPDGFVWYLGQSLDRIDRIDAKGADLAVQVNGPGSVVAGHPIDYEVVVSNTGTEALTGVTVTDDVVPDCNRAIGDLAAGASSTVSCSRATTFADRGTFTNVANVVSDQTPPVASNAKRTSVTANPVVTIDIVALERGAVVGESLDYRVFLTNAGNVPLTGVALTDANVPDCDSAVPDLPVGGSAVVDCALAVTSSQLGSFATDAVVATNETSPKRSNRVTATIGERRSLEVTQVASSTAVLAGTAIDITLTVANAGDVPLETLAIADDAMPACARAIDVIAVGGEVVYGCRYLTAPADVPALRNVVRVSGTRLPEVVSEPLDVAVTIPPAGFTDVAPTAFYADAVDWAALFGVVPGATETTFRPANTVTRARFVDALFQMMDHPPGSPRHPFADVPRNASFRRAVDWAVAQGLVGGARANFRPGDAVSRADVVKLAWLMVGAPTGNPAHGFTDVPAGARYSAALKWATSNGLLDGFVSGARFKPDRAVTRGQLADVLFRLASTEAAWPHGPGDPAPPSTVLF